MTPDLQLDGGGLSLPLTDDKESSAYDGVHFCGVPSSLGTGSICRRDKTNWDGRQWKGEPRELRLAWVLDGLSPSFRPAVERVFSHLRTICAVHCTEATSGQAADFLLRQKSIDGGSGTLAYAYLPCGPDAPQEAQFDTGERWWFDVNNPPSGNSIDALAVAYHEFGHLLGLPHDEQSGRVSLMNPTYNPRVRYPLQWDIEQLVLRYGPPLPSIPVPTPPTNPPSPGVPPTVPPAEDTLDTLVIVKGVTYRGSLRRVG